MRMRPMAAASALVLTGAIGLSACSGGPHPNAAPTSPATTAPIAGAGQPDGSLTSGPAGAPVAAQSPAVSDGQLSELDQGLSAASGSLGSADQDVTHTEAGDATP